MAYTFFDLEKYLDSLLVKLDVPGFDCKITHKGKEVFRHSAGYADRENKKPITDKTQYFIYSCSKPIMAAAALHAFEEGYFILNEPIWHYLPEFRHMKVKDKNGGTVDTSRDITIQDLFTMGAGFNYDLKAPNVLEAVKRTGGKAPTREIIRSLSEAPLEFQPGELFGYSLCHDVLACLVEVATGTRFADYVKKIIFDPLGMKHSFYHMNDEAKKNMASLYVHDENLKSNLRELKNDYILGDEYDSGGAGIITTLDDYSKFAAALASFGTSPDGVKILSKSTVNLMRTNLLFGNRLASFQCWASNSEYGYGYGVRTKIGEGWGGNICSIGEFGWDGAAGSLLSIDPEREISIVYMQHVLNPRLELYHPTIKNLAVLALGY